jgi:hypothetical protein
MSADNQYLFLEWKPFHSRNSFHSFVSFQISIACGSFVREIKLPILYLSISFQAQRLYFKELVYLQQMQLSVTKPILYSILIDAKKFEAKTSV